jgi:vacuolar protein sorting-associated protein 13A/C
MNYFTQRMKFKIDCAELKFSCYEASDIKGLDCLIGILMTVYLSRMKYKVLPMPTAFSFEEWKNLAARDAGGDDYVAGDIMRLVGNLAGKTAGFVPTKVGQGLGSGVITVMSAQGNKVEQATDKVGARAVGAGVNSVVSGLGGGVGNTIKGGKECDSLFYFD